MCTVAMCNVVIIMRIVAIGMRIAVIIMRSCYYYV